jgi:hypothetical protein
MIKKLTHHSLLVHAQQAYYIIILILIKGC